ncbi:hypothetical protein V8E54_003486 [Elaphomyces granulatus]
MIENIYPLMVLANRLTPQIYTYPIKSLRPTALTEALVTRHGFPYDRHFMLLKVETNEDGSRSLKNMHVPYFPEMTLFLTELVLPDDENGENQDGKITVTYQPPSSTGKQSETCEVPLQPDVQDLEEFEIVMHESPTKAYNMGDQYNGWFSDCFGYSVVLAYLGTNRRQVLGSVAPNADTTRKGQQGDDGKAAGWLLAIQSTIPYLGWKPSSTQGVEAEAGEREGEDDEGITFADCAAYLVVSQTSVDNVSARLPSDEEMDVTKFRPNIVVSGAETAFEEDFWGELTIGEEGIKVVLTSNCVRCRSLNVDYATGDYGTGESGKVLRKLMADRRVDKGAKYKPAFGRYGFLVRNHNHAGEKAPAADLKVRIGDRVEVSKILSERSTFY